VHCCKNIPLFTRIPVYATRPVIDLGRTLTQDLYSSTPAAATTIPQSSLSETAYAYTQTASTAHNLLLQSPTPEEIARYFSLVQALKYSQPLEPLPSPFSPPLNGLTITAYNSGHTLGGTIWHIQHGLESIVYAVDWNQARENVFAGAAWLGGAGGGGAEVIEQLRKPTALICSSRGGDKNASGGRAKRDEHLIDMIKTCVTRGGTVLIPVDSSARVLEMAYLLEHAWRADAADENSDGALRSTKLYLAGRNMSSTMRYARSMLEWMDDSIVQEFEAFAEDQRRTNGNDSKKLGGPLDFKYLRLLERRAQIAKLLSRDAENVETHGRVILASDSSLEWGLSKDLLKGLAKDSRNLVILTDRPSGGSTEKPSIARTLWEWWKERKDGVAVEQSRDGSNIELIYAGGRDIEVKEARREALEGEELALYQQWLATQRQLQATQQAGGAAGLEATADAVDDASSESSSDSEDDGEQQGKALNVSTALGTAGRKNVVVRDEDLGVNILIKKKGAYDFETRGKKGRERSFPLAVRRKRNDDFGELIRPEDFLRAEEKEDDNTDGMNVAADDDKLGKKRKWDDVAKEARGANARRPQMNRAGSAEHGEGEGGTTADGFVADELDDVEDAEPDEPVGPSKLVWQSESVTANLRIGYVDFSGLHDKRSLNMLIPLIQPRKLILIAGSQEETMTLAEDCRVAMGLGGSEQGKHIGDVLTPAVGELVDASVDTNAWVVKLADPLVKKLKWQNVRGLGIVTISGRLLASALAAQSQDDNPDEDASNKRQKTEPSSAVVPLSSNLATTTSLPTLDAIPPTQQQRISASRPLHVGDLRLADLRRAMQGAGHHVEFRGEGVLVVDGTVAVRKTAEGRVEVESVGLPMAARGRGRGTMYEVKRVIYENLAVVAGA
jgi:cleavage and polyadenylation specificity factor subunit 2